MFLQGYLHLHEISAKAKMSIHLTGLGIAERTLPKGEKRMSEQIAKKNNGRLSVAENRIVI